MRDPHVLEAIFVLSKTNYFSMDFNYSFSVPTPLALNIRTNVFRALLKILISNNLINYDGQKIYYSQQNKKDLLKALNEIQKNTQFLDSCEALYSMALPERDYFFDELNEAEYEVYSRANYDYSYSIGQKLAKYIDFNNSTILDIGGNSGGLAGAIATECKSAELTVIDYPIPCQVGEEYKKNRQLNNIDFIIADMFSLKLKQDFDYVILSNILHDFNNQDCQRLLRVCIQHTKNNGQILIVEDILTDDFEPQAVIQHGLRLAINVKDGRQRTVKEITNLINEAGYILGETHQVNDIHLLITGSKS